jgi:uncharacterized protein
VPALDPRSPLVLDTRELGRRAGAMQQISFTAPAPEELGVALIGVPAGSDIDVSARLESVIDGVLVSATARVTLAGECSRCLEPITSHQEVSLQELYGYPATDARGREIPSDDDEEAFRVEGDLIDLEPVLRDAVVLGLPMTPVCSPDCPGLCPRCGLRLEVDPEHSHEEIDPRWAALGGLVSGGDPEDGADPDPDGDESAS